MTTEFKPLLTSRTVWANIVGLAAIGLAIAGVPATVIGDQAKLVDAILQLIAAGSFVASTAGRIAATKRLI